jgi:hypothetical protein
VRILIGIVQNAQNHNPVSADLPGNVAVEIFGRNNANGGIIGSSSQYRGQ